MTQPQSAPHTTLDGATDLPHWGLMRALGDDAASFLHGQLTQDINGLGAAQARLAGYCSVKGRLLASLLVLRPAPGEVLLACAADVLPAALKRLSMFVLRAKCKLSDAGADLRLVGLVGSAALAWADTRCPGIAAAAPWAVQGDAAARAVRLPDAAGTPRVLWLQPRDAALPPLPALPAETWDWLDVQSGVARVVGATAEQFVPQMVNLELVGAVNFQKGCYPGQEVVARSQYRGTLKRRAFLFAADEPALPGQEVFSSDDPGQPAGMVANAASLAGSQHRALVELKIAALGAPALHLGTPDGPRLTRLALPYEVPLEAA